MQAGTTLGHFRIVENIGAGGMAEGNGGRERGILLTLVAGNGPDVASVVTGHRGGSGPRA